MEAPFSSSSINHLLVHQRLTEMGDCEGETPHSFRRGTLQATDEAQPASPRGPSRRLGEA